MRFERENTFSDGRLEAARVECESVQNNKVLCEIKRGKADVKIICSTVCFVGIFLCCVQSG